MSLMRHELMDELGELAGGLLSATTTEDNEGSTTLLQDLDTLHRNLDDLQGVKGYVMVVKRVLELRYVFLSSYTSNHQLFIVKPQYHKLPLSPLQHQYLSRL